MYSWQPPTGYWMRYKHNDGRFTQKLQIVNTGTSAFSQSFTSQKAHYSYIRVTTVLSYLHVFEKSGIASFPEPCSGMWCCVTGNAVKQHSAACLHGLDRDTYHLSSTLVSTYKQAVTYLRVPLIQRLDGNKLQLPIRDMHYSIMLTASNQHHSIIQIPFPVSVCNWGNLTSFLFRDKRIALIKLVARFTLSTSHKQNWQ
jgi:hypothetical protein